MTDNKKKDKEKKTPNNDETVKPDPETLDTSDPQEHMEGPVSSLMHKTGEAFDTNESKEHADRKKDENK